MERLEGAPRFSLQKYVEVPLRRPLLVLLPFVLLAAGSLGASAVVEKRYRSSTLILVEKQKVPESFVPKGQGEETGRRLLTIRQEILSRTRLERVLNEVDPYPDDMERAPLTALVERMRGATTISVKGTDAFSVEFIHPDPRMAMRVVDRLATLFIEETVRAQESRVADATQFIESELEGARRELEAREQALRQFKEEHMGSLPEQTATNLATLQRLQLEQQATSASLQAASDRLQSLELSPVSAAASSPGSDLTELRAELATLRTRYTDEHPDVRALLARIARLQSAASPRPQRDPTAALIQQQTAQARQEVQNLRARGETIDRRISALQAQVDQAPRTEQKLSSLTRDYEKLNENYLALLNKKLDAQMAQKLEERWKQERFRILDPAFLPEQPAYPSPMLFLLGGVLAGLAAGLALAFVAEFLDHSVKGVDELEEAMPYPVIAAIPHITSRLGRARRPRPVAVHSRRVG